MKEGRYIGAIWYPYEDIKVFERLKMAGKEDTEPKKKAGRPKKEPKEVKNEFRAACGRYEYHCMKADEAKADIIKCLTKNAP